MVQDPVAGSPPGSSQAGTQAKLTNILTGSLLGLRPISGPAETALRREGRPGWGLTMRGRSAFPEGGAGGEAITQGSLLKGDPMEPGRTTGSLSLPPAQEMCISTRSQHGSCSVKPREAPSQRIPSKEYL